MRMLTALELGFPAPCPPSRKSRPMSHPELSCYTVGFRPRKVSEQPVDQQHGVVK